MVYLISQILIGYTLTIAAARNEPATNPDAKAWYMIRYGNNLGPQTAVLDEKNNYAITLYDMQYGEIYFISAWVPPEEVNYSKSIFLIFQALDGGAPDFPHHLLQTTDETKVWKNYEALAETRTLPIPANGAQTFFRFWRSERDAPNYPPMPPLPIPAPIDYGPPPLPPGFHLSFWQKFKLLTRYRPGHHADTRRGAQKLMEINK